jgi:hypothetical protein
MICRLRADSASYAPKVVEEVTSACEHFYIRARQMEVAEVSDWRPFGRPQSYRLVVSRIPTDDEQGVLFGEQSYIWRAIMTNDTRWSARKVTRFYNRRGAAERNFDALGSDFGWKNLPCSFLGPNTAFMILTANYRNFTSIYWRSFRKSWNSWNRPSGSRKLFSAL